MLAGCDVASHNVIDYGDGSMMIWPVFGRSESVIRMIEWNNEIDRFGFISSVISSGAMKSAVDRPFRGK